MLIGALAAGLMYWQGIDGWPLMLLLGTVLHPLATLSKRYTLWKEVQAYRKQAGYYADDRRLLFASFISTNYGLTVSTEKAYAALIK